MRWVTWKTDVELRVCSTPSCELETIYKNLFTQISLIRSHIFHSHISDMIHQDFLSPGKLEEQSPLHCRVPQDTAHHSSLKKDL